jgi:glycogen debranching enzyme
VDSTPLFIILAEAYHRRTADLEFLEKLWPHVTRAVNWMQRDGDEDGDGFLEYSRQGATGIHNQGWKDSNDSVFHEDGRLAEPPIALCEVQAYAFAAYRGAARLARILGHQDLAETWLATAEQLRKRFEEAFWSQELGTYVLALDQEKRPCKVKSSNAGQCLFSGIASPERARLVAESLLDGKMFSGWGVRTIAEGESRYNPMSYHNGSIWPHDNALIAWGLAHYNLKEEALHILDSQFQLSQWVELHRQPELVCGFSRREGAGPTRYPVACSPQAWAAGSVFMFLSSTLGLELDAIHQRVIFNHPRLPASVKRLTIERLQIGHGELDVEVERFRHDVSVNVLKRTGPIRLEINK